MTLGLFFWLLFVLWFAFSLWAYYPFGDRGESVSFALLAALIFVLGWGEFGFIIKG
jgi:hypothetical protein